MKVKFISAIIIFFLVGVLVYSGHIRDLKSSKRSEYYDSFMYCHQTFTNLRVDSTYHDKSDNCLREMGRFSDSFEKYCD